METGTHLNVLYLIHERNTPPSVLGGAVAHDVDRTNGIHQPPRIDTYVFHNWGIMNNVAQNLMNNFA